MHMQLATASPTYRPLPSRVGPLPSIPQDDRNEDVLDAIGTVVSVARGAELYGEGEKADCWYQVRSGMLRTYKLLSDGRRQIDAFLMPGDFLGFEGLSEHSFAADAITKATVVRYSRGRIDTLARENARFGAHLLQITLKRLSEAHDHLMLLGRKTAEEKIVSFLLDQLDRAEERDIIELPMSRGDIADYLGLTIETVSRTLSALKQEGMIELPNVHQILVLDREALQGLDGNE